MAGFTVEQIEVQSDNGVRPALLYTPDSGTEVAGLLLAPGGLATGATNEYTWAGEFLAREGYACLILTYGAANPYGDATDILAAMNRLGQSPHVNPARMGVIGHSRGGLGVLAATAREPRLKALVSIAAPADLPEYLKGLAVFFPAARGAIVQFLTGEPDAIPERYESINPLRLAAEVKQPALLVHGTADMRVPFHHAHALEAALRAAGNQDVSLELVPAMGHYFEQGTTGYQFDKVMSLIVAWLRDRL